MKIGICANVYQRWGEECYRKIKEHGYSYIDYNMADTDTPLYSCSDKEFEDMLLLEKKRIHEAGIRVSQVHGPWRWPSKDGTAEDRAERMEKMKKSIRGTALLECKNWVVHPIMPYGIQDKNTENAKDTWNINLVFMKELLKTAREYDVTICLENMPMPDFSIGSPSEILRFVQTINDDHFKICLDTGHAAVYEGLSPADAVRELRDEIRVLHIHDNNGHADQHLLPYFGIIDWADFGQALRECEFEGVFSYETAPPERLPESVYEEMCKMLVDIAKDIMKI